MPGLMRRLVWSAFSSTSSSTRSPKRLRRACPLRIGRRAGNCESRTCPPDITRSASPPDQICSVLTKATQDGPKVLDDISFHVKSGERVGIGVSFPHKSSVLFSLLITGLNASGAHWQWKGAYRRIHPCIHLTNCPQSSLTLALLRCILTEGAVYFDGVPTNRVNLDALRAHITIIPQNVSPPATRAAH